MTPYEVNMPGASTPMSQKPQGALSRLFSSGGAGQRFMSGLSAGMMQGAHPAFRAAYQGAMGPQPREEEDMQAIEDEVRALQIRDMMMRGGMQGGAGSP